MYFYVKSLTKKIKIHKALIDLNITKVISLCKVEGDSDIYACI
jgi:hypothetical protein